MRLKLISCEVFVREMCAAITRSPNEVDVEFLPKGLHDLGREGMIARLQDVFDDIDESLYDAAVFGYGLCNNGLVGLEARRIPIVLPRAHDCITMFLGSKNRYFDYFQKNPGTYFLTSGWIERGEARGELSQLSIQNQNGMNDSYEELVEKYGEDNAQFLWEELVQHTKNYGKYAFIEMGIEPDDRFEKKARKRARERGWSFEKLDGKMTLIRNLVDGNWNEEDFLSVPPGYRIAASHDQRIVKAVKA